MSYNKQNTDLLKTILNASFFKPWSKVNYSKHIQQRDLAIELYVTSVCNQKCEYCYLVKHGNELYPSDLRDQKKILKNLTILIDYLIENNYHPHRFDVFSGEILQTSFGLEILRTIYEGKKRGLDISEVHIPTNCSFLLSEEATKKVQEHFDLLNSVNVHVYPSASVDGFVVDNLVRPFNDIDKNSLRDQAFYDRLFEFITRNSGGFHPMISAYAIEYWPENIDWWYDQCNKFNIPLLYNVMTLEVRNDDWTPEKIKSYTNFLQYYSKLIFEKICNFDQTLFTEIFTGTGIENHLTGYHNLHLFNDTQIVTCSISHQLTVRLGDLAICPCHRTSYPEYIYGYFKVEDDKIVDIEGNNPFVAAKILMMNQRVCHHGCDTCWNKNSCIRQCLGAQHESGQEIFMPIESVCNMLKEKTLTVYKIYNQYNVYEELIKKQSSVKDEYQLMKVENFLKLYNSLQESLNSYGVLLDEK